jgi:hypothetical protein
MNWAVTYYRWWDIGGCARVWCIVGDRGEAGRVADWLRHAGLVHVRVEPTSFPEEEPPPFPAQVSACPPYLNN